MVIQYSLICDSKKYHVTIYNIYYLQSIFNQFIYFKCLFYNLLVIVDIRLVTKWTDPFSQHTYMKHSDEVL